MLAAEDSGPVVLAEENGCACTGGRWIGGAGLYLVTPVFNANPAFHVLTGNGNFNNALNNFNTLSSREVDFSYPWGVAPQGFVGYVGENGLGLRVRYFQFDHGSSAVGQPNATAAFFGQNPLGILGVNFNINPAAGDLAVANSSLSVLTWDFEVTQEWNPGQWRLTAAAGVRYAHMSQTYRFAYLVNNNPAANGSFVNDSGHNFNGAGPTLALEARRAIGTFGLALYANARISVLFGDGGQSGFSDGLEGPNANNPGAPFHEDASRHQIDILPVGELEIGAEYGRDIGRFRPFLQLGLTTQVWVSGGNASNTSGGLLGVLSNETTPNFGLVGMVIRAGLNY